MLFQDTAAHEESRRAFPRLRGPRLGLAKPWVVRVREDPAFSTGLHCVTSAHTLLPALVQCQGCQGRGLVSPSSGLTCACL